MFTIGRLNKISLTRGDDATMKVRLYNGRDQINVADGTLEMTVRKVPEGDLLFNIEADDQGSFAIGHDLTKDATTGQYVYDLQYTDENGYISTVVKAEFNLLEEVTYDD